MTYDGNTYHVVGICFSGDMCLATRNGNIIGLWHTQSLQVLIGKMMGIKSLDFCYGACFFRQHLVEMVISFWLLEVGLLQGISPR